jgi:hypothetical protein
MRALAAADTADQTGRSTKDMASLFTVCPGYVDLVRHLDEDGRRKLVQGEVTLAQLRKEHLQRRAEQRVQQRAAEEREAQQWAAQQAQAQTRQIDLLIGDIGFDPVIDRLIDRLGPEFAFDALNERLRQRGIEGAHSRNGNGTSASLQQVAAE